ncbi:MAG: aldehyde dehydrogenase family protein, partial [Gammaproteobacteria bacterium]|nr:aldehyde dehydrogenase family protein [Gammaproteobacteria bacterium]
MSQTISVRNPYTGVHDYQFVDATVADVRAACERVRSAQPQWAAMSLAARLDVLQRFGECILAHREELVSALTADTGRAMIPGIEVDGLAGFIRRAVADAPRALASPAARPAHIPSIHGSTNRIPFGVVGNISPWNFPVILSFIDTFPALAAGNAVVIKPSEVTPRWVEPMRAAIAECPEVAAVLDIVVGTGQAGAALVDCVDAVVFTGSVPTGRKVAEGAARNFIPAYLELGGKDPAV